MSELRFRKTKSWSSTVLLWGYVQITCFSSFRHKSWFFKSCRHSPNGFFCTGSSTMFFRSGSCCEYGSDVNYGAGGAGNSQELVKMSTLELVWQSDFRLVESSVRTWLRQYQMGAEFRLQSTVQFVFYFPSKIFLSQRKEHLKKKKRWPLPRQKRMSMDMGAWHHHQAEASSYSVCLSTSPSVVCKQVHYTQSLTFTFNSWWCLG